MFSYNNQQFLSDNKSINQPNDLITSYLSHNNIGSNIMGQMACNLNGGTS